MGYIESEFLHYGPSEFNTISVRLWLIWQYSETSPSYNFPGLYNFLCIGWISILFVCSAVAKGWGGGVSSFTSKGIIFDTLFSHTEIRIAYSIILPPHMVLGGKYYEFL